MSKILLGDIVIYPAIYSFPNSIYFMNFCQRKIEKHEIFDFETSVTDFLPGCEVDGEKPNPSHLYRTVLLKNIILKLTGWPVESG